jgi:hypothetical protein
MLRSLGASGAKVKRGGGTEVNARAESAVESEFDVAWSVGPSGCDFFLRRQFASQTSRGRGADDEWPVKVFNSSVENRVEKSRREIKN